MTLLLFKLPGGYMSTLQELLDQQAALTKKISVVRDAERARAIADVRALMSQHGLTAADVAGASLKPRTPGAKIPGRKVAAKYRHPETGTTWSGRGLKPKWLVEGLATGKSLSDFAI